MTHPRPDVVIAMQGIGILIQLVEIYHTHLNQKIDYPPNGDKGGGGGGDGGGDGSTGRDPHSDYRTLSSLEALVALATIWKETFDCLTDEELTAAGLTRLTDTNGIHAARLARAIAQLDGYSVSDEPPIRYAQTSGRILKAAESYGLTQRIKPESGNCIPYIATSLLTEILIDVGCELAEAIGALLGHPAGALPEDAE